MDWRKISIERLKDYESRKNAMLSIPEQLESLELEFTSIRAAATDGQEIKGGGGCKREDALINNIVKRDELKRNYKIAKAEIAVTERGLKGLTEEEEKILHRFYICRVRGHVELLCEELNFEKSRVYAMKDDALKKFTLSCYGIVEL